MADKLQLSRIQVDSVGPHNFFREIFPKKQIFLHHSYSHPSPILVINEWRQKPHKTATSVVIAGKPRPNEPYYSDGEIYQAFPAKYWALHLGLHAASNKVPSKYKALAYTRQIEQTSIGITLCNAGHLEQVDGKYVSSFGLEVPPSEVIEYPDGFRGKRFYHKYSDAQIESLRQLLVFLCDTFKIPKTYNPDIWDVCQEALDGKPGIYSQGSIRSDVRDCHPQPELIAMLSGLASSTHTSTKISV
jgi:hypothetical protein